MGELFEQLKSRIYDQKYCSARALSWLSNQTGVGPEQVAQGLTVFLVLLLELSSESYLVANSLLIFYPAIVTYVFPEERPTRDLLLIYWSCLGLLTTFDRFLDPIPFYYVMKLCLLALFFLKPFSFAEKIQRFVEEKLEEYNLLTYSELINICRRMGRSPPPAKPLDTTASSAEKSTQPFKDSLKILEEIKSTQESRSQLSTARLPVEVKSADEQMKTARLPIEQSQEPPKVGEQSKTVELLKEVIKEMKPNEQISSRLPLPTEPNPMQTDSSYRLRTSDTTSDNREIGLAANLHDLLFWPMDAIVFNAPFDVNDLTYHMKIKNNSKHRIAYAIKGNCIPMVMAMQPHGLLVPGETKVVAVTVKKFEWNEFDFNKHRIAYDYVLLKDEDPADKFSHKLLQKCDTKRRKNIKIVYNP